LSGEILSRVIDIVRFQTVALSELEAVNTLGSETRAVLLEAAASPFTPLGNGDGRFAGAKVGSPGPQQTSSPLPSAQTISVVFARERPPACAEGLGKRVASGVTGMAINR
jgi:hypothetical protein